MAWGRLTFCLNSVFCSNWLHVTRKFCIIAEYGGVCFFFLARLDDEISDTPDYI